MNVKKPLKTLGKAGAASFGVVAGSYGMSMIPKTVPGIGKGAIGLGVGLGVALLSNNPYVQSVALGISASGTLVAVKAATEGAATEGQTGILAEFNQLIPTLGNPDEQYYLEPSYIDQSQVNVEEEFLEEELSGGFEEVDGELEEYLS